MNHRLLLSLFIFASACDDDNVTGLRSDTRAPDRVDFGRIPIGLAVTRTITVENAGSVTSRVTLLEEGFDGEEHALDVEAMELNLAPGAKQDVPITMQIFVAGRSVQARLRLQLEESDVAAPELVVELTGEGVSALSIDPSPADFGLLLAGSSRELDVTLTNQSDIAFQPAAKLANGRPVIQHVEGGGRFEIASTLGANGAIGEGELAPGGSIVVRLRYVADSRVSVDAANWIVLACANPLCEYTGELKGETTLAALACTPDRIDFGTLNPGASRTQVTLCTNVANEDVELVFAELDEDTSPEISLIRPTEVLNILGAGETVEIELGLTASSSAQLGDEYEGTLSVSGWNPIALEDLPPVIIPIQGQIGGADIAVLPEALVFSTTAVGTYDTKRILVLNVGFQDLVVSGVSVAGDSFTAGGVTSPIPPGGDATLEVTFAPTAAGVRTATLLINSNDPDTPQLSVPLAGDAVDLLPCEYSITPRNLNFGIVAFGNVRNQSAVIENLGADDCLIRDVVISGASDAFSFTAGTATTALVAPGDSLDLEVRFSPATAGAHEAQIDLYISSPVEPDPIIGLHGFGEQDPQLVVVPDLLDFGQLGVDCRSTTRTINIFNTGTVGASIDRIDLVSSSTVTYQVGPLTNNPIAPGGSSAFTVTYYADAVGIDPATLEIYQTGRTDPYVVALEGEGAVDPRTTDVFGQLEAAEVDVLFVIDHSGSMGEEQMNLGANFTSFIRTFDLDGVDYHLGVTTTDTDDEAGRLVHSLGNNAFGAPFENRIVSRSTLNAEAVFADNVSARALAGGGAADEAGFAAAALALSPALLSGDNADFIRPTASLALVFVSDEAEQSPESVDYYTNFFRSIKGFANTNLFSVSAIVGDDPSGCSGPGGNADAGGRYIAAAAATGGVFGSICTSDWADILGRLGTSIGRRSSFILTNEPVPGSIEVEVDGVPRSEGLNWMFDPASNRLSFLPLSVPESGQTITVTYVVACL